MSTPETPAPAETLDDLVAEIRALRQELRACTILGLFDRTCMFGELSLEQRRGVAALMAELTGELGEHGSVG